MGAEGTRTQRNKPQQPSDKNPKGEKNKKKLMLLFPTKTSKQSPNGLPWCESV